MGLGPFPVWKSVRAMTRTITMITRPVSSRQSKRRAGRTVRQQRPRTSKCGDTAARFARKCSQKAHDGGFVLAHCERQFCVCAWRHVGRSRSSGASVSPSIQEMGVLVIQVMCTELNAINNRVTEKSKRVSCYPQTLWDTRDSKMPDIEGKRKRVEDRNDRDDWR